MCEPISLTVAAIGLSALSTGANLYAQEQQSRALKRHQKGVFLRTVENADSAARSAYSAGLSRIVQERASTALRINQDARGARSAIATVRNLAATRGVSGAAVGDVEQNVAFTNAEFFATRNRQLEWNETQIHRQLEGIRAQQQNRIIGALGQPIPGPDYLGAIGGFLSNAALLGAGGGFGGGGGASPTGPVTPRPAGP